jgi:UDPglucose 6-dehydrogenase
LGWHVKKSLPEKEGSIVYCESPCSAATHADAVLILTQWQEYRQLDLPRLWEPMNLPLLVDGRNLSIPSG